MAPDTLPPPPAAIDVTGLPADAVRAVEALVAHYRTAAAGPPRPRTLSDPPLSREEFRKLLDEMASMGTGHVLPPDFSRADIYDDHD